MPGAGGRRERGARSRRGGALICALSLLLAIVHVRHVVLMDTWLGIVVQAVVPLLISVGLVGLGIAVFRGAVVDDRDVTRLVGWYVTGMVALLLVGVWILGHGLIRGVQMPHTFSVVTNSVTVGGLVGAVTGTYDARKREYRRELARERDRLEDYADVIAHDLRNPINVATGYLDMTREDAPDERLDSARQSLERCTDIVDDVLTLAKAGRSVGDLQPVDLEEAAEGAWAAVETHDASLDVEGSIGFEADASRLGQVLENLFRNAVEHGGEDVAVRIGPLDGGFFVSDDGPGIPADTREQVFDAGYSTGHGTTGLGLNIVREIVEAHGWGVHVSDAENGGARFEVTGIDTS